MQCFFNLAGAVYDPDDEGTEMASLGDARIEAARYIAGLIRDQPDVVWSGEEVRVEVTDSDQQILFTVIVIGVDAPTVSECDWTKEDRHDVGGATR
ncbi:DUF6894 family protein [Sphingomonas sp. PB4P5]|uniref:DUF6894 family protein n=1 Tax=Parasphingomonas puruogangriensis TaxID=3096155 RepID=UPI002FC936FB